MTKFEKKAVEKFYTCWSEMVKDSKIDQRRVGSFFLGAWIVFSDNQAAYLIGLLSKKEFKIIMNYPIWL